MGREVLLYVPNLIGYTRLVLLLISLTLYAYPPWFLGFYVSSIVLDAFDGFFARRLNQESAFGSWFDVVIDLISRGALWCFLNQWCYFIIMVEWLTFVATHCRGADWKIPDSEFPAICRMVMAKGFKTPLGVYTILGIFLLPLWCYGIKSGFLLRYVGLAVWIQYSVLLALAGGRIIALIVELFFIQQHIKSLLCHDDIQRTRMQEELDLKEKK